MIQAQNTEKREKLENDDHARKSNDLTSADARSLENSFLSLVTLTLLLFIPQLVLSLSDCPDEPVNPPRREGESSPVNAEVMTRVATLKNPRRVAIATVASTPLLRYLPPQ